MVLIKVCDEEVSVCPSVRPRLLVFKGYEFTYQSERGQVVFQFELQTNIHRCELVRQVAQYKWKRYFTALCRIAHPAENLLRDRESTRTFSALLELIIDLMSLALQNLTIQVGR